MTFRQLMGVAKRGCLVILVILICASFATSLKDREEVEMFLIQLADPITGDVNTEMAELLWVKCKLDLIQLKEAVDGIDLCSEESPGNTNGINLECQMLTKEKTNRMLTAMHPHVKQTLLDCLRKNFHVSGEDYNSEAWYTRYLESLLLMPGNLRRKLSSRWVRSAKEEPASAPESSLSHKSKKGSLSPPNFEDSSSESSADEKPSRKASSTNGQSKKKSNNNQQTVVIAVVVTATVTFIIVALLFLCFHKSGSKVRQNDEHHDRPLLSLSLSSSPKYSAFGNSIKEDKLMNQSSSLSHHQRAPSLDGSLHLVSDGARTSVQGPPSFGAAGIANNSSFGSSYGGGTNGLLPPPPGAVLVTSDIMPPLKPPPGRAVPLPPEPPSSFKAPSTMASPPPPPPPGPPPSSRLPGNAVRPPGAPPPPPPAPGTKAGPRPPPPPPRSGGGGGPRPPPPLAPKGANPPRPPRPFGNSAFGEDEMDDSGVPKAKLKPFFWDKVLANPDNSMVWHQLKAGSFQFNEEMIETLFGYTPVDKNKSEGKKESSSQDPAHQYIQIIDSKKSQNLSILLRALNVTREEVRDALHEGTELPTELLENLLRMAPTPEEELKLRLFSGELTQLGTAERFLKCLVDIPFAFKRLESLLFIGTLQEDITITRESFVNLEIACQELRSSRLFLKLLEAVLKTGNRMNVGTFRGGAHAFKLDTLLKLSDVKGKDGKTTLLHFVVQEIIRTEGIRAARNGTGSQSFSSSSSKDLLDETFSDTEEHYRVLGLQVVSCLSGELQNVKKAATIDADALTGTVSKLGHALLKTRDFLNKDMQSLGEESKFHETLKGFVQTAEVDIMALLEEEKRIMELVKSTGDYFHGNAGKDEGLRLFVIVRDFLIMLDKTCREVKDAQKKQAKGHRKAASSSDIIHHPASTPVSSDTNQSPSTPVSSDTNKPPSTPVSSDTNQPPSTPVSSDTNHPPSAPVSSNANNPPSAPVSSNTNHPPSAPVASHINQPPSAPVSSDINHPPSAPVSSDVNHPPSAPVVSNMRPPPSPDFNQLIFPAITDRRMGNSSSDDESP